MLFEEINLQTNTLSSLYHFYRDVLGLSVEYNSRKNATTIFAGNSKLIFEEVNSTINPFYHFAFNIPFNKFQEAIDSFKKKVELLWLEDYDRYSAHFVNWNAQSFYFLDPAGNIVELIARFDLNDNATEPFSTRLIRNISEIGLVFPKENFDIEVNEFLKRYPVTYFNKQPPMPQFRAIGNDEGLFIIVHENRI